MQPQAGESVTVQDPSANSISNAQSQTPQPAPSQPRTHWPEWCAVSFYAALVSFAIPYHEPWADEAQAWQLARSLPLGALFKTYIRYEGSPGLWHFFLWILIRAHIGYSAMHWICGAIALAAASLLILASPLPRYLKLTLPFTSFLLFQYAVVARNYVLVPILLFLVAWCWKKHPLTLALALGLLANTALHAAAISSGLAVVFAIEQLRAGSLSNPALRRKLALGSLIVVALYGIAIWTAWPPHDLGLTRVRGESHTFFDHAIVSLVWGICQPWILSIPFWIVIAAWFGARRKLLYLLPVLFFAIFSGEVYANWWHVGLLVPTLVCLLWITCPPPGAAKSRVETIGGIAIAFMIATQILWSGYALFFDHYHAYSPDRAAAAFLKPLVQQGDRVAITYIDNLGNHAFAGVGILPYFDHNIYANQANPFWWWSDLDTTEDNFNQILPTHPQLVLVEIRFYHRVDSIDLDQPKFNAVQKAGYKFSRAYCGSVPEQFDAGLTLCHVIFHYDNAIPSSIDSQRNVQVSR